MVPILNNLNRAQRRGMSRKEKLDRKRQEDLQNNMFSTISWRGND